MIAKNMKYYIITMILVAITILLLTIGYSAFSDNFSITDTVANVRADANTRVTSVTTNSSYTSNLNYNVSSIENSVNIPNGSSVTYQVTITTYGNVPMALSEIKVFEDNSIINNVSVTPDITDTYIKICDTNDVCTLDVSKTVDVTITNNTGNSITTDNLKVEFTFTPFYTVTYNNIIIGDVLRGGTFIYTFEDNVPSSVIVDSGVCNNPQVVNDTLTISNVTSDLVLTGTMQSSGSGTWSDPYRIDSSTYDYSNLDEGSYLFTNSAIPGNPEITVDANHKVTRYELTNCGESGLSLDGSYTLESGVLAFDNQKITINLEFTANLSNSSNYYKHIVTALVPKGTNTYSGFIFMNYKSGRMYVYRLNGSSIGSSGYGGY